MNNLGVLASYRRDHEAAEEWFKKAAEQGDANAQYNLGLMYEYGQGVDKDYLRALNLYQKAAYQGNSDAQYRAAGMYASGQIVPRNDALVLSLLEKSAAQGNVLAQTALGLWYASGPLKDLAKAASWYQVAASNGSAESQHKLAKMYVTGNGVPKSNVVAYALCILAGKTDKVIAPQSNMTKENLFKTMTRADVYVANNLAIELVKPQNFTNALTVYLNK